MRLHARANPSTETSGGLSATLIAWGEVGRPHDDTGRTFDVVVEPGGLVATDGDVLAFDGHRVDGTGDIIGAVRDYTTDSDGFHVDIETWSLTAADRVRELGRHLPLSVSAEFTGDNAPGDDGTIRFTADSPATLTGVAVLDPLAAGAFPSARVTKVASRKEPEMETTTEVEATAPSDGNELALVAELRAEMAEEIRRSLAAASSSGRSTTPHPLAKFASLTELQHAALTADGGAEISATFAAGYRQHRDLMAQRAYYGAFVDQITTDNPGVVPPSYLTNVYGLIDTGRRVVNAIGGPTSAGDSGMVVNWPYYDGDLSAIVAEQLTEKSDINSVKVSLKKGQADLATYAGGSDVSYQLIRRSSPAYLSIYERILTAAYNVTTDSVLADTLVADGSGYVPFTPATATGEDADDHRRHQRVLGVGRRVLVPRPRLRHAEHRGHVPGVDPRRQRVGPLRRPRPDDGHEHRGGDEQLGRRVARGRTLPGDRRGCREARPGRRHLGHGCPSGVRPRRRRHPRRHRPRRRLGIGFQEEVMCRRMRRSTN
jgi:hypothetical protein